MIDEDVSRRTIALSIRTGKLTAGGWPMRSGRLAGRYKRNTGPTRRPTAGSP